MEWFKWYPALYEADTAHLTAEQDGIYRRLIDRYMQTRQPLPDNDNALARYAGVSIDSWCHASAIVKAFFRQSEGRLYHDFCDKNLDEQDQVSNKKSMIGKKGAEKRWKKNELNQLTDSSSYALAMPTAMPEEKRGEENRINIKGISAFRDSDLSEMNDWFSLNAPSVNKEKLRSKILDWCSAKGKTYKDYFAAMRTWAVKEHGENVSKGWTKPKTPVNRNDPYAHLTGGSNA